MELVCGTMLCIMVGVSGNVLCPPLGGNPASIMWPGPTAWCLMQPCAEHLCSHHCTVFDATLR